MKTNKFKTFLPLILAAGALPGCNELPAPVADLFEEVPRPSEAYRGSLEVAGLLDAPLGKKWLGAADDALSNPARIQLPFREVGFFEPGRPEAAAYRFPLRRGDALEVRITWTPGDSSTVFVDLFQAARDGTGPLRLLSDEALVADSFRFEPRRDRDYVMLLRPPLLAEGRYEVELRRNPTLAFPVGGHGPESIRSVFGDPREGGRRSHHGVDIFAPRGTPAVAGVDGVVSRVDTTRLGGRVVWLRDRGRRQSLYYAHLDSQTVVSGQRVRAGDTVGLVGNTGNARTTPPHLHFGIYRRGEGPLDPVPFVQTADAAAPEPATVAESVSWWRTGESETLLRVGASRRAEVRDTLTAWTPFRVVASTDRWARVHLPNGVRGYLPLQSMSPVDGPVASRRTGPAATVLAAPDAAAPVRTQRSGAGSVDVLGRLGGFDWVALPDGTRGWLFSEQP